jgi:hypothetical protein
VRIAIWRRNKYQQYLSSNKFPMCHCASTRPVCPMSS